MFNTVHLPPQQISSTSSGISFHSGWSSCPSVSSSGVCFVPQHSRYMKTKLILSLLVTRAAADENTHFVERLVDGVHDSLLAADHALYHTRVGLHRLIEERPHCCLRKRFRSWRTATSRKSRKSRRWLPSRVNQSKSCTNRTDHDLDHLHHLDHLHPILAVTIYQAHGILQEPYHTDLTRQTCAQEPRPSDRTRQTCRRW